MSDNILELKHITKLYPGVVALNDVSLEVRRGEILALVGENGAGKSTLIKTCSGAITPTQGEIVINGKSFTGMTPQTSEQNGIGVIYQEFNLVGDLSVAENIFLGRAIRKGMVIDLKAMERESKKILDSLNIKINPKTLVKTLSVGYQQMVEIAKAVSQNAKLLIMDEPSAPLTSAEVEAMFAIVDKLKAGGVSIIYISHRLDEIFRLADRITILRDGQYVTTLNTDETNKDELVKYMVGRQLTEVYPKRDEICVKDEVIFEAVNVSGNGDKNISFKIHRGEVLGLGGLVGAGRTEFAELMFGMRPKTAGKFIFKGKEISPKTPKDAIELGIGLVPEDRKKEGALLGMSIRCNINNLCPDVIFFATPPIDGVFQEYVAHEAALCFKIPDNMDTMEAALIEPLAVGMHAARQGNAHLGQTAVVTGAGCIGLVSIMSLKAMGVTRIIAVDVQEKRLQKALELGATDVINGKEKDTVKEIFRLTGGAGADLTIETAGTEITTRQAINFAKPGSTIVLVGYSASGEETLPMSLALDKELTFKTVFRYRHIYPVAIEAVAAGSINVKGIVSNVWDFDDIENAMIQSVKDKANIVKSVIKIG